LEGFTALIERIKQMNYQHIENLLIRYRGNSVDIKTISGGVYEGSITDVTNDYVALKVKDARGEEDTVVVLLHAIESVLAKRS
jgi:hypothetical protein